MRRVDPVDPERAPLAGRGSARPGTSRRCQLTSRYGSTTVGAVAAEPVVEAHAVGGRGQRRERGENGRVDLGVLHVAVGVLGALRRRRLDGADLAAQAVGQHLLELGQRAGAAVLDAR